MNNKNLVQNRGPYINQNPNKKQIEMDLNKAVKQIKHKQLFKDKVENNILSKHYYSTQNVEFQYDQQQQEYMDSKQMILSQQEKQLQIIQDKIQEREKEKEQQKTDRLSYVQSQFLRSNVKTQEFIDKMSYQSPLLIQKNRSNPSQEVGQFRFGSINKIQNVDYSINMNKINSVNFSKNVLSNLTSIREYKSEVQDQQTDIKKQIKKNDPSSKQKQNIKKTNQQKIQDNIHKLFGNLQKLEQNKEMISIQTLKQNLVDLKQNNKLIIDRLFLSFGINPHQEPEVMIDQDRFSQIMQFIYQDSIPFSKKVSFVINFMKLNTDEIEYDKIERILRVMIIEQTQNQEQLRIAYSQIIHILQKISEDNLIDEFQLKYVLFQQLICPQMIIDLILGNVPDLNTESIQMLQTQ